MVGEEIIVAIVRLLRGPREGNSVQLLSMDPVFSNPTDETASRVLNTDYQNTHRKPLLIVVDVRVTITAGAGSMGNAILWMGSTTPPGNDVSRFGHYTAPANCAMVGTLTAFVPTGWYYRVGDQINPGNTIVIEEWWEYKL